MQAGKLPESTEAWKTANPKEENMQEVKDNDMTADERAEVVLIKTVKRLESVVAAFELPYRHRESLEPTDAKF